MKDRIRILLVEDNPTDAELASRELKRAGINFRALRVETVADYRRELEAFRPQVILCDYSMPKFDGLEALRIARQSYPDIPFIFVSGTIGEESAVLALKNGAKDYVLKGNLLRLPAAVERALKETEERRVRQAHERSLRVSEKLYRTLFESDPDPTMVYDIGSLRFLAVNDTAVAHYGYSRDEFLAMIVLDILIEKDRARLLDQLSKPLSTASKPESGQHRTKSGELLDVEIAFRDLVVDGLPVRVMVSKARLV